MIWETSNPCLYIRTSGAIDIVEVDGGRSGSGRDAATGLLRRAPFGAVLLAVHPQAHLAHYRGPFLVGDVHYLGPVAGTGQQFAPTRCATARQFARLDERHGMTNVLGLSDSEVSVSIDEHDLRRPPNSVSA